jgi:hypothetical protein
MTAMTAVLWPLMPATVLAAQLLGWMAAEAATTPEELCLKLRYKAAAKYAACQLKAEGTFAGGPYLGVFGERYERAAQKCLRKYAESWGALQAKFSGTGATCDAPRYVDNGDGTVTDNLTALRWEKKTDDGGVHDKDNLYVWSTNSSDPNGTVFDTFLATLNSGGCFAGHCDWRLPTHLELQTIILAPPPCPVSPCIDAVFGPTEDAAHYQSGTDSFLRSSGDPVARWTWGVRFGTETSRSAEIGKSSAGWRHRAVRGGLL